MFVKSIVVLGLVLVLLSPGTILAAKSLPQNGLTWQAQYWNNVNLAGEPVLQRHEVQIDYDWGTAAPNPTIHSDNFSARWTRYIETQTDTYRFTVTSDDGIRVWVDGVPLIDEWYDHAPQTFTALSELSAGYHWVVVEYYEHGGSAMVRFTWQDTSSGSTPWHAYYFNNATLGGIPAVTRDVSQINADWNYGSPVPGQLGADHFSIRWTQTANLPGGSYRFEMTVDDGGRLWVNNVLLMDAWRIQSPTTYQAEIYIPGGATPIRMEYFENTGSALARLTWIPLSASEEWSAEYFDNPSLSGWPVVERTEARLDHDWGTGSPVPGVPADDFSARWVRYLVTSSAVYRFTATSDDGIRVWVDNDLVVDAWYVHSAQALTVEKELSPGYHRIKVEYFEQTGMASARLEWAQVSSPVSIVVDDSDTGFSRVGPLDRWQAGAEGYGSNFTWTLNYNQAESVSWGRWSPDLAEGQYHVLTFIPSVDHSTTQAQYLISHADGYAVRVVDQSANGGHWVSLGAYRFRGTRADSVLLTNVTREPGATRFVVFDAIVWIPVAGGSLSIGRDQGLFQLH